MIDTYPTHSQAYSDITRGLLNTPHRASPRQSGTREQRWVEFAVSDPLSFPVRVDGRETRDVIGVLEACSIVGQFSVPELFTSRVAKFKQFIDGSVFHGSYGARVHGQLLDLVELLERDADTRQAVLTIYDRRDLNALRADIPCTLSLQFLSREVRVGPEDHDIERRLEMRTTMRSNDVWLGLPYDLAQFGIVQGTVAQLTGQAVGPYVHSVGSLHLYDRDAEQATLVGAPRPRSTDFRLPLWAGGRDLEVVSKRARDVCLDPDFRPETLFEAWAHGLLRNG